MRSIFPTFNPLFELCYQPELGLLHHIKRVSHLLILTIFRNCSFCDPTKDMRWYITTAAFTWIQTSWPLTWHLSLSLGHQFSLLDDCWWPWVNGHSAVMLVPVVCFLLRIVSLIMTSLDTLQNIKAFTKDSYLTAKSFFAVEWPQICRSVLKWIVFPR